MNCQGLLKILSVTKLGLGGATRIIGNQGWGRIHICRGGMGKNTSLRVIKSVKLSLDPPLLKIFMYAIFIFEYSDFY